MRNFSEKEILAAKQGKELIATESDYIKGIYMAGEINAWIDMQNVINTESASTILEKHFGSDFYRLKELGMEQHIISAMREFAFFECKKLASSI